MKSVARSKFFHMRTPLNRQPHFNLKILNSQPFKHPSEGLSLPCNCNNDSLNHGITLKQMSGDLATLAWIQLDLPFSVESKLNKQT